MNLNYTTCLLTLVLISICSACFSTRIPLSAEDLQWMDPYQKGDTLVFVSDKGNKDTNFIVSKKIYYSDYKPNGIAPKYISQMGEVLCQNTKYPKIFSLLTITKENPTSIELFFSYKTSSFLFCQYYQDIITESTTSISINGGKEYTDIIEIRSSNANDIHQQNECITSVKVLYWSKTKGLLKYQTTDNQIWTLYVPK